jgi:Uma2 family endonuclease
VGLTAIYATVAPLPSEFSWFDARQDDAAFATMHLDLRDGKLRRAPFAEQIVSMPALRDRWTEREVRQLIEDAPMYGDRLELVDSVLYVTPAPSRMHQRIVFELAQRLTASVRPRGIGEVLLSPGDVRLAPELVVQPDVYVVPSRNGRRVPAVDPVIQLLLAVEVLSPLTERFDRGDKRMAYQSAGVPELWIVDATARTFERWRPNDEFAETLDASITWTPSGHDESLVLDVRGFFTDVSDDAP